MKLKSRKLWLALILMVLFTVLVWIGKLGEENYINAMLWLYGVYSGANVLTKFTFKQDPESSDKHE
ncbi:hypothetical protein [Thermosipho globiformans]|uniref:hypothetical protein n=1 Tax=Thermosipho globiformans TaxID=380685 RepID=UPI000F8CC000|nr:hypothetical protein [Thermosipho globiformans]